MVTIRNMSPGEVRDLHRNLAEWWAGADAAELAARWAVRPEAPVWYPEVHRALLLAADSYLVTDELAAVCRQAGLSMPWLSITRAMLPSDLGFIVFNDNLLEHDPKLAARMTPAQAFAWRAGVDRGVPGVWVNSYEDIKLRLAWVEQHQPEKWAEMEADGVNAREGQETYLELLERILAPWHAPMQPSNLGFIPYGEAIDWALPFHANADHSWLQMLVAAWLLMDQPITVSEKPPLQRAFVKRAERAGLTSDLNVIMLRRPRSQVHGAGESGRQYHSRWIVQGHWRKIPTPEQPHRITWVHDHVKGPVDAPLVVRDRVTVLGR